MDILSIEKIYQVIQGFYPQPIQLTLSAYKSLELQQEKEVRQNADKIIMVAPRTYDYLYDQDLPVFCGRPWQQFNQKGYYNQLPSKIPQESSKSFWKWQQRRLIAYSFCQQGYGVQRYIQMLSVQRYTISPRHMKRVLFEVLVQSIEDIQIYVHSHITPQKIMAPTTVISMLAHKLFYPRRYLMNKEVQTLFNVIKMYYYLPSIRVRDEEVKKLYRTIRNIICFSQYFPLRDKFERLCQREIVPRQGPTLSKKVDLFIVRQFLECGDYEMVRDRCVKEVDWELGKLRPVQIKDRLVAILKVTLAKVNAFMEMIGVDKAEKIRNHRELNLLARNERCREIHMSLFNFFLNPQSMDSTAIFNFSLKLRAARQIFKLGRCQKVTHKFEEPLQYVKETKKQNQGVDFDYREDRNQLRQLFLRYRNVKKGLQ